MDDVGETTQEWRQVLPLPAERRTHLLDSAGLDTRLARFLGKIGRIDFEVLRAALIHTRQQEVSLARALVAAGHLSEEEAAGFLEHLMNLSDSGELDASASDTVKGPTPPGLLSQSWNESWTPGARIGDYELGERLGAGGMGVVFRAREVRTGRAVALKAIAPNADAELVERFEREGQAQMALPPHPNLVRVHATGAHEGRQYFVMDLIEGQDLREVLRGKPHLEALEAARITAGIARGLEHLHRNGVLHRDVKPANVVLDPDGRPLLVDFGIARVAGQMTITHSSIVLGTPSFMSPEQALNERDKLGPRSDVYALAVLLYWLLTGQVPFKGSTPVHVLSLVTTAPPTRPRLLRPDIPAELEDLILQNMAKAPEGRLDARDVADALEAYVVRASAPPRPVASLQNATGLLLMAGGVALGVMAMRYVDGLSAQPAAAVRASTPLPSSSAAPPPSSSPSPSSPSPAPSAAPAASLGVRLPTDAPLRYELATESDMSWSLRGEPKTKIAILCRLQLEVRAEAPEAERQRLRATITGLVFEWSLTSPQRSMDRSFDSALGKPDPLDVALGKPLTIVVHTTTGEVLEVGGGKAIQREIDARVTQRERGFYRVPIFDSPATLANQLGALLHVFPARAGRAWSLEKPPADLLGVPDRQRRGSELQTLDPPAVTVACALADGELTGQGSRRVTLPDYDYEPPARAGRTSRRFRVTTSSTRKLAYTGRFRDGAPQRLTVTDGWETLRVLRSPSLTVGGKTYPASTIRAPTTVRAKLVLKRLGD